MNYQEVLEQARGRIAPKCRVCRECNGIACRGEIPGLGGKGTGSGFIGAYEFLSGIKLKMDVIYEDRGQDTAFECFGKSFAAPVFVAPIGAIGLNYNNNMDEYSYGEAVVEGAALAGCAAFTGDGVNDVVFNAPLQAIRKVKGLGVPTIKPWGMSDVLEKIRLAEEAGAMALAMDVDSAGLALLAAQGKPVYPKSPAELAEIISSTSLPFVIKGVMTAKAAVHAAKAGAYGIVVSNHGGRVLDYAQAPCAVLPEIRAAVGEGMKIWVDGAIRSGGDVFKAIALGADGVLIGRPYSIAAFGGGKEGVALYTKKITDELKDTMKMTGCAALKDIAREKISLD